MNEIKNAPHTLIKSFVKEVCDVYLPKLEEIYREETQLISDSSNGTATMAVQHSLSSHDPAVNERICKLKYVKEDEYTKTFSAIISWIESGTTLFAYFIRHKCVSCSLEALLMQSENAELLKYLSETVFLDARISYLDVNKEK